MSNDTTHPNHYARLSPEPIDVIEAWGLGPAFCVGNAIKYLARAGHKAGAADADDLAKAEWYVARARAVAGGEKLTDATMVEQLQADLDRLRAPVEEAPSTGLPDRTPRQLTETVRALEDRTDTLTGLVRDLTRRVKALEARPRVSPKRKVRAAKGGAS